MGEAMPDFFNPDDFLNSRIFECSALIFSRLEELKEYAYLVPLIKGLIENPKLSVMDNRLFQAAETLFHEGLIDDPEEAKKYFSELIKKNGRCSFFTAPGSRINDHHSYPGGLAYHTAADIELALAISEVYNKIYGVNAKREILIISLAIHDIAKAQIFEWDKFGEYRGEMLIAGTEAHHIFSIAEAMKRLMPFEIIRGIASCHNRASPPEKGLQNFLKAASIIACTGYSPEMSKKITVEDLICLYADSDWMVSKAARKSNNTKSELFDILAFKTEFNFF